MTNLPCERAVGIILFYGDSVLLCKRCATYKGNPVPFPEYWCPFTGAVEKGESFITAALRELKEESGLQLKIHDIKYIKDIFRSGGGSFILYAHELDEYFSPKLDLEHTEFGYFKIEDLSFCPRPLDPTIHKVIDFYVNNLRHKKP